MEKDKHAIWDKKLSKYNMGHYCPAVSQKHICGCQIASGVNWHFVLLRLFISVTGDAMSHGLVR